MEVSQAIPTIVRKVSEQMFATQGLSNMSAEQGSPHSELNEDDQAIRETGNTCGDISS